jgi:hypothetical protein
MGLLNYLMAEEEDVQRRANVRQNQYDRQVGRYNTEADALKTEMSPYQKQVEDYNKSVVAFNGGWQYRGADGQPLLFSHDKANNIYHPITLSDRNFATIDTNRARVYGSTLNQPFDNVVVFGQQSNPKAQWDVVSINRHAKPDEAAANAANAQLQAREGQVNALNAKSQGIQKRGEQMQKRTGREVERLQTDIDLNRRRAMEQAAQARQPVQGSAFDELRNLQTIADWLRS